MKKLIALVAALLTFSSFAAEFTPDHFEGIFSASSRSEDIPEYCKMSVERTEDEGKISFNFKFEYKRDPLTSFTATSAELKAQLIKKGTFVTLKNSTEQIQINVSNFKIINYTYIKTDSAGKLSRKFTCSNR